MLREDEAVDSHLADIRRLVTLKGHKDDELLTKFSFVSGLPSGVALQLKSTLGLKSFTSPMTSQEHEPFLSRGNLIRYLSLLVLSSI